MSSPSFLKSNSQGVEKKEKRTVDPLEFVMADTKKNKPNATDLLPPLAHNFKVELANAIEEYKQSDEGKSHLLESLSPEQRKQIEAEVISKATKGPKNNRIFMQPQCTATEILGSKCRNGSEHSVTSTTQPNIDTRIVIKAFRDISAIEKRLESLPAMTMNEIKGEVHRLAAEAYPTIDGPESRVMREQYVYLATPMLSGMLKDHQKLIEEDARDDVDMDMDEESSYSTTVLRLLELELLMYYTSVL